MTTRRTAGLVPLRLAGCTLLAPRPESFHFVVLTHVTTTEASPPRNGPATPATRPAT